MRSPRVQDDSVSVLPRVELLEKRQMLAMAAYFKLNETTGVTADDYSPANYSGTLVNGPVWSTTAISGGSLQFDGVDDYVEVPAVVGSTPVLSVAFWARASVLKNQVPLDKMPLGTGSAGWNFKFRTDGSIWLRVGSNSAFTDIKSPVNVYAANTWVHVAATFTGGTARVYINGVQRATTSGITRTPAESATPLRFGVPSAAALTETFGGQLDDVRIYDHALSASEVSALATTNANLQAAVNALPSSTTQLAVKKAVLNWALQDATASVSAGLTTIANDTYDDVRTLLAANIGTPQATPSNLFPEIRSFSTNPLAQGAVSSLASLRNSSTTYTKNHADLTVTVVNQGLNMAWGMTHPQSPYFSDATLVIPMLRRFQKTFEANLGGVYDGDFATAGSAAEMYLMFKTVFPDLILPSRQIQWEAAIKLNADLIQVAEGARFAAAVPGTSWVNAHVRHINALRFAYEILGTQSYRDTADDGLQLISYSLLPDGGFLYDAMQNEVYTYHGENIIALARYWQVTGDPLARDLVEGSYWYYPLSSEPNGTAEYSTASSWKHYWNQVSGAEAAYIVADLANSPENLRVAQWVTPTHSLYLSTFYRPDLVATASPDNYIAYDRNIFGPRGRFGNYSFSGTATPYTGENRGKTTHVGAMVTDFNGTNNGWRLNAALDAAQSRVRFLEGPEYNTLQNDVSFSNKILYYEAAVNEKNAYTVNDSFAALSTSHQLSKYKGTPQPWKGEQQWLMTPTRMIGLVALEATSTVNAYSMVGSLRFVAGRGSWGVSRNVVQVDANTFSYGKMTVDVIEQNYGPITTTLEDTWDATTTVVDNKSARLNFVDAAAAATNETTLLSYPAGTRRYYLVEVRPDTTTASAEAVTQTTLASGLISLDVTSDGTRYQMLTNPTASPITYTVTLPYSAATLHMAGQQYRPEFLNAYQTPDVDPRERTLSPTQPINLPVTGTVAGLTAVGGTSLKTSLTTPKQNKLVKPNMNVTVSVTIPAYQHIVIEADVAKSTSLRPLSGGSVNVSGSTDSGSVAGSQSRSSGVLVGSVGLSATRSVGGLFNSNPVSGGTGENSTSWLNSRIKLSGKPELFM